MFKHIGLALLGAAQAALGAAMPQREISSGSGAMKLDDVAARKFRHKGKGRGIKRSHYGRGRSIALDYHEHIRERARHRFPPGAERRAFMQAETPLASR